MKKFISLLIVMLMIISLCACSDETQTATKGIMADTEKEQDATSLDFPVPKTMTYEESANKLGYRYVFTLKEYTDMLNEACKNLGEGSDINFFNFSNWTNMSDNLTDDNGVMYESYCYVTDMLTITAAVEKESQKVMQVSCGAPYKEFEDGGEQFQYDVILTTAILSMVAGGYNQDALSFLYTVFYDSAKEKQGFFYHNNMYMVDYTKGQGDEVSVVLFMTSPCKDEIKSEWGLKNYTDYAKTNTK